MWLRVLYVCVCQLVYAKSDSTHTIVDRTQLVSFINYKVTNESLHVDTHERNTIIDFKFRPLNQVLSRLHVRELAYNSCTSHS
jgi:hypothetical protein